MELKKVETEGAPEAIGPYSQGITVGDFVFCSGQIGLNPKNSQFATDDVQGQTQQAIHNLCAVLEEAGSDLAHVVKTTVFLTDISNFKEMNDVYEGIFSEVTQIQPARSTVAVRSLPRGALVEIEAIAVKR
jgi:2-iminobutanoate/2-iminopropanoate deaminase